MQVHNRQEVACKWTHHLQGHAKFWEIAGSATALFFYVVSKLFLGLQEQNCHTKQSASERVMWCSSERDNWNSASCPCYPVTRQGHVSGKRMDLSKSS